MRIQWPRRKPPLRLVPPPPTQLDNVREQISRLLQEAHERLDKMLDRLQRREKERIT